MRESFLYAGGALTILWGAAHLYPTKKVADNFGRITRDNRLILTMEWIAEAILLIFTGVLVAVMTARFGADGAATRTAAALGRGAAGPSGGIGGHRRAGRLHHVSPVRADLRAVGGPDSGRRLRLARLRRRRYEDQIIRHAGWRPGAPRRR